MDVIIRTRGKRRDDCKDVKKTFETCQSNDVRNKIFVLRQPTRNEHGKRAHTQKAQSV